MEAGGQVHTSTRHRHRHVTADARMLARAVIVEGAFAILWFSWGPTDPPRWLAAATTIGAVLALATVVSGVLIGRRVRDRPTTMEQESLQRRYRQIVVVEGAVLIGVGVLLGVIVGADWAAVWVCGVVGGHFFPLARVLPGLGLTALGAGITTVAVVALLVGLATDIVPPTVTGPGTGLLLLLAAAGSLATLIFKSRDRLG